MADYTNPTESTEGTTGDDYFLFNTPLVTVPITSIEGLGGYDRLRFAVPSEERLTLSAQVMIGVFNGTLDVGSYGPRLGFFSFEALEIVGTSHDDRFELMFFDDFGTLTANFDGGAGNDRLVYDFSNMTAGQSFAVAGGTITSSWGQFAGFESFEIRGGTGSDVIQTGDGNDYVVSSPEQLWSTNPDTVSTGGGNDEIRATAPGTYDGGDGTDTWTGAFGGPPGTFNTTPMVVNLDSTITISNGTTATNVENVVVGTGMGNDVFNVTRGGIITLYAGDGQDRLNLAMAVPGPQTFEVITSGEMLFGSANQLTFSEFEEVSFTGGALDDSFRVLGAFTPAQVAFDGGAGSDLLHAEFGALAGSTQFVVAADGAITSNRGAFVSLERFELWGGSLADTFVTGADNDMLLGGAGADSLDGGAGNDQVFGEEDNDTLLGGGGDDVLDGGSGNDTMTGGLGDDLYYADSVGDTVVELAGQGTDTMAVAFSHALTNASAIENLVALSAWATTALNLTGNAGVNALTGNAGTNVLNGGAGADAMAGLGGNDLYYVDNVGDVVSEAFGEGIDIVLSSVSYALAAGAEVEGLQTADVTSAAAINLTGNELANVIRGNAGNNNLNGGGGDDSLVGYAGNDQLAGGTGIDVTDGGAGNDYHFVDNAGDIVIELDGGGTDTVFASASYALAASAFIEGLQVREAAGTAAINLTGNQLANTVRGNAGVNILKGGDGNDSIFGNVGNDQLIGGGGIDVTDGGTGNDLHFVDSNADIVIERAGEGTDTVYASVSYTLGASAEVEQLSTVTQAATDALNLNGNGFANMIVGNAGVNTLRGYAGNDWLSGLAGDDQLVGGEGVDTTVGGLGNDLHFVDNAADVVSEHAGEGTDVVYASVSYTLAANVYVEGLQTGVAAGTTAIDLTGNALAQTIVGNAGANVLNGGGGNDMLSGLVGADSFAFTTALGAGNVDKITDFSVADDTIRLDDAVFTGLAAGGLAAGAFAIGAAATQADDHIIYNSATGALYFDADGSGGTAAVQFATLSTGLALTSADFLVV